MSRPREMGGSSVPRPRPDVQTVEVGAEVLLYDPVTRRGLPLNATAAVVWQCLDGQSSIREISADLAEHFDAPLETVVRDTVAIVAELDARGVLGPAPELPPETSASGEDRADLHVVVGNRIAAITCDEAEVTDLLGAALAPARSDARSADTTLRVEVDRAAGRLEPVHFLWLNGRIVLRTPHLGRLLRATLAHLGELAPTPPDRVRLDAHILLGADTVVLVGGAFRDVLDVFDSRLYRAGWCVVDGTAPLLDRASFEVVLAPPPLDLDGAAVAAIDARYPRAPTEPPWGSRRLPVRCLIVAGSEPDLTKLASPAQRLAGLVPLLRDPADLAWLVRRGETRWVTGLDEHELVRLIGTLPRRAPRR